MELFLRRTGVFLILILLTVYFFKINGFLKKEKSEIIRSDGLGYYSYLPAIFIYGDLSQEFVNKKAAKYYNENFAAPQYMEVIYDKPLDKYFVGTAVLMYPFFIIAHWLSYFLHHPMDGYSVFYQYLIGLSAVFYVFLGLLFCERLLRKFGGSTFQIFFILSLLLFGTNLFFYAIIEPTMSHAFSFSMIAAFIYFMYGIIHEKKANHIIPAFISLGLIILIRPVNILIILAIPFLAGGLKEIKQGILFLFKHYFITVSGAFICFLVVAIQFIMWYAQTGHFIVYSYTYEKFYFDKPHFVSVLFSYQKGFFIYTPLLFLSLIGFIHLFKKNRFSAVSLLLFLITLFYILSCWFQWYFGGSFGYRPLVEYYALFALLLLFSLQYLKKRLYRNLFILLCMLTLVVNQVQAYQYRNFIIHWYYMSRYKYWKVFLKTDDMWKGYVWNRPEPSDIEGMQAARYFTDFETSTKEWLGTSLKDIGSKAHSGKMVTVVDAENEFSNTLIITNENKITACNKPAVIIYGYLHPNSYFGTDKLQFVVSYDKENGENYSYHSRSVDNFYNDKNGWKRFEITLMLDKVNSSSDKIKIYFWNPEKKSYWIDDVSVNFVEQK